ncbi:UBC core domain-containing protein [Pleurotus pulmonarius]
MGAYYMCEDHWLASPLRVTNLLEMATTRRKPKVYPLDLVKDKSDKSAIVLKTWLTDDMPDMPIPQGPLEEGRIVIHYVGSGPIVVDEQDLQLVDRPSFQPGDCCRRTSGDIESGVVLNVQAKGKLYHVINGEAVPGWRTVDDIDTSLKPHVGYYIVYNDWIGEVVDVVDEVLVETSSGQLVSFSELRSPFVAGDIGQDILPSDLKQRIFTRISNPNEPDTVLNVQHIVYAISWLAINQTLSPAELQSRTPPQRYWYGDDLAKLTYLRDPYAPLTAGEGVVLKDVENAPKSTHTDTSDPTFSFTVHRCVVIDDHDCWPGDYVVWKGEGKEHSVVVQKVNPAERTATVLFTDSNTTELVSLLELDPHGSADPELLGSPDEYGVGQGDIVFIHPEGQTNGHTPPHVPRLGVLEPWAMEAPVYGENASNLGWRKELCTIGSSLVTPRKITPPGRIKDSKDSNGSLNWLGHVTNLRLDGSVEVTHPDGTKATYPLVRLTKLYDTSEQLEDLLDHDHDHDHGEDDEDEDEGDDQWILDAAASYELGSDSDTDMEGTEDASTIPHPVELKANQADVSMDTSDDSPVDHRGDQVDKDSRWKRFEILSSTPRDHAFYSSSPAQPSKSFLGRLQREYKILMSSLPDTILVRAFEDRTDLLRSLIMGPDNTPYEDAPFVIDWQLDSNFPNSPPIAHFHSWTNGNGRVNPNLYEEGKVCLSILGTWQGDRTESWRANRSSLLQAFVSIQGLVLVKEPWYCEPGFEKMRGTDDATMNSRLYSEKAYVLTRAFVRRALETPPGGLESELRWMYFDCGRLKKVILQARSHINVSQAHGEQDPLAAIPRLTTGGIILLERTLSKLEALQEAHAST